MPPEVAAVVRKFGAGLITYSELVEAVFAFIASKPDQGAAALSSLEGLPDPLLGELRQDIERVFNPTRGI